MFCNNVCVLCLHVIVTEYVLIGEIAGNKHPVLLLFKYLGATLTSRDLDAEMAHTIQSEWKKTGREGTGCSVCDAGTCAVKKAQGEVGCGGNEDVKMYE